ncbi:MAG: glycosyltransferase family 2 protein [Clostridia bacterium]|nr:glycosyltransferase family 2 protein [Clostridia bacterium]MBR4910013.1 glycosyltransferase family 2 protein [Clostridia bacterium]
MKKEISIIIPCYNTEEYIAKCLDSVTRQLIGFEYEIILIDDASKDNTVRVIEDYISSHDCNVVLLKNEKNSGAGYSRNKAVRAAKYEYISFIDSDDYISDTFYEKMFAAACENADMVACDIVCVEEKTGDTVRCDAFGGKATPYALISTGLAASPCNKLIKKEYLLKYPFAEGMMNEDVPAILAIAANCERVAYAAEATYYYIQREGSVQNSLLSDKRLDIIKAVSLFEERIKDNPEYGKYLDMVVFNQIICFALYVPAKERGLFSHVGFLRKFGKLSGKYDLPHNQNYLKLLSVSPKKQKLFFKYYIKFLCGGLPLLASALCDAAYFYKKYANNRYVIKKNIGREDVIAAAEQNSKLDSPVTVTAAIPNYNYADFLYERLYSILYQNYRINELIILDDCSTDNSRELIDGILPEISKYINVKKIYNTENSGSPFKQWKRALEAAGSDYIWIAEADDYCDKRLLASIMAPVERDRAIVITYADTAFINKSGKIMVKTIKPEIDLMKTGHWNRDFVNSGIEEIKNYAFLNCTIANVSSAVFKKDDYSDIFDELINYRQVGDYYFYLSVMQRGKIAFKNKPLNYYRMHGTNVTSTTKKQLHLEELKRVHSILQKKFGFSDKQKEELEKRYQTLKDSWKLEE